MPRMDRGIATGSGDGPVRVGDPIARAGDGVQQLHILVAVNGLAQVVEVAAQRVGIGQGQAPDLLLDLTAAHHPRRFAHQDGQDLQRDRCEVEFAPAALHPQ